MAAERDFITANADSNAELHALVARLSDADLAREMSEGWTVASMLAHLAFYDFRAAALIDRWQSSGMVVASPLDADLINAASEHLLRAISPRRAATLALEAADAADQRVAAVDSEFLARIEAAGRPIVTLQRAAHRRDHVAQIEKALGLT